MKIFIGPTEISGIASGLQEGFRQIKIDAEAVFSHPHPFQYKYHLHKSYLIRAWQKVGFVRSKINRDNLVLKAITVLIHNCLSVFVFLWALYRFDAFIFIFGRTITNTKIELILLRLFKKKSIFLYVGSDTRPAYIDGVLSPSSREINPKSIRRIVKKQKRMIAMQEKYAFACINSPSTAQLHSQPFINWFSLGLPKKLNIDVSDNAKEPKKYVRILHCPSNSEAKGTSVIVEAINRLKDKGHLLQFVKIEKMPHEKVLQELANCDFVVDQLYSDSPMAAFVTEAAHFGKPAVVAGYFSDYVCQYLNKEDIPPSLFVHPEKIEQAIEKMILNHGYRQELGLKARTFVQTRWAPEVIAGRYLQLLEGNVPKTWWCDPKKVQYLHGSGVSEMRARTLIHSLITIAGKESLKLCDNPELEKAFLRFANCSRDTSQ